MSPLIFRIRQYLSFLYRATNEHGVHSPFIYQYLTKCLYKAPRLHPRTSLDVLLKSVPYFGVRQLFIPAGAPEACSLLQAKYPGLLKGGPPHDLIYLPEPDPSFLTAEKDGQACFHNETLCIVDRINADKAARAQWEAIKALQEVRVTIDGFSCGLLFFRTQQAREHFTIRI